MERKIGTVRTWNDDRGFGIIVVTNKERYFLHISQFEGDSNPVVGQLVSFEFEPAPRKEGQLPRALDVMSWSGQ